MGKVAVLALVVAGSGCLVLPRTVTTERKVGTRTREHLAPDASADALAIQLDTTYATVIARASWQRVCQRETFASTEVRRSRELDLTVPDPIMEPQLAALGAIGAIFTLPISLLVSGLIVTGSADEVSIRDRETGMKRFACPLPASRIALSLYLPSGARLDAATSASGSALFTIPAEERRRGFVAIGLDATVAIAHARRYEIAAAPPGPAQSAPAPGPAQSTPGVAQPAAAAMLAEVPDAKVALHSLARACVAQHADSAGARVRATVDADGLVQTIDGEGVSPAYVLCIGRGLVDVRFGPAARGHTLAVSVPSAQAARQ